MAPYSLAGRYQQCGATCYFHFEGYGGNRFFKMLVPTYKTLRHHIQEYIIKTSNHHNI